MISGTGVILDSALLIWGFLFSTIGLGFFMYGKKVKELVPLGAGVALMIYPYFMPNTIVLVIVGLVLLALPWLLNR